MNQDPEKDIFDEYFEWVSTGEPERKLLMCKKECWIRFWSTDFHEWNLLKEEIPDWEYKILKCHPQRIRCDLSFSFDVNYFSPSHYVRYPENSGVITVVYRQLDSIIKEIGSANGLSSIDKKYICLPGQPIIIYDYGQELKHCIKIIEKQRTDIEKKTIRRKMLEKQRKKLLEKEVLDELVKEGLIFPDAEKRPHIPREVVDAVWRRDKGRCVYCNSDQELQLDHIIPFSKGGATTFENLQLLCRTCNNKKSNNIG